MAITDPLARPTDPDTSHAAASELDPEVITRQQAAILELLREHPEGLPDWQLTDIYFAKAAERGWPITNPDSIRKRRSQLKNKKLVTSTGKRFNPRTHRDARVWTVAAA